MTPLNEDRPVKTRSQSHEVEVRAVDAKYDLESGRIVIFLSNGIELSFPSELGQGLSGASPSELAEVEITPSGQGLHWESLDADLSIPGLMNGIFGTKHWMTEIGKRGGSSTSVTKTQASRENGKKGGRPRKRRFIETAC